MVRAYVVDSSDLLTSAAKFPFRIGYRHEQGEELYKPPTTLLQPCLGSPPHWRSPDTRTTVSVVNMVSMLLPLAFSLQLAAVWAGDNYLGLAGRGLLVGRASGCSTTGPLSCHNTTVQDDLCCFNAPGVSAFLLLRRK